MKVQYIKKGRFSYPTIWLGELKGRDECHGSAGEFVALNIWNALSLWRDLSDKLIEAGMEQATSLYFQAIDEALEQVKSLPEKDRAAKYLELMKQAESGWQRCVKEAWKVNVDGRPAEG